MGRPKNKKNQAKWRHPKGQKNKRAKQERFWIEDCKETKVPEGKSSQMEVLITRIELTDDYRQVPKPADKESEEKADISASKEQQLEGEGDTRETLGAHDGEKKGAPSSEVKKEELPSAKMQPNVEDDAAATGEAKRDTNQKEADDTTKTAQPLDDAATTIDSRSLEEETSIKELTSEKTSEKLDICVKRSRNAKVPLKKFFSAENFKPLPNGDCGDGVVNPYPKNQVADKFWSQRRRLFTRFDEGIQLCKESWYSVTPEAIADHIAAHLVGNRQNVTVLDPFVGCGGNAIAFARIEAVDLVVCIDTDLEKLKKASDNAQIYGIPKSKMVFIHANACRVLACYQNGKRVDSNVSETAPNKDSCESKIGGLDLLPPTIDMIFLSPPWGGMDYVKVGKRNYTLSCIKVDGNTPSTSIDGDSLISFAASALGQKPLALFLPRNINGIAMGESALKVGYGGPIVLEQNVLNGKLKTVTAYLGLDAA